jgi:glutamate formiminotransferase / 5-formyltetrahydrofolate cyclo-ligase
MGGIWSRIRTFEVAAIMGEVLQRFQGDSELSGSGRPVVLSAMPRLIESVPNISEGRRPEVIEAAVAALKRTAGLRVLDVSSDADHNRSVLTLAGDEASLREGLLALFGVAVESIDLRKHSGEHPRMGAVDVVPFIPIEGATMGDCVALARGVAEAVAERYGVPIFLYEEAASAPHRKNLEDIRRGEFEGLAKKMADAQWRPDFGPAAPHASAGASVVGARMPLIAYNVNLGTSDLEIAKRIAKGIRHSTGGYRFVKAMGVMLEARRIAQVSINMTDFKRTPLHRVLETVRSEAARYGVPVVGSEIVGLVPSEALMDAADHYLQLESFNPTQVLERRIRESD